MEYAILKYHTGSVPGQGLLCQNALTEHYQQPHQHPPPHMDGYSPYEQQQQQQQQQQQPLSEAAVPWSFSCLSPTQFAIQNGNFPAAFHQQQHPDLALDVKAISILSPMTVTDFELGDRTAQQGLPSPTSPLEDFKPVLILEDHHQPPPPPLSSPPTAAAPASPPPPKARRSRPRREPNKGRHLPSCHGPPAAATTPAPTSSPPQRQRQQKQRPSPATRKAGHSAVERKYRESMNDAMNRLRAMIPSIAGGPPPSSPPASASPSSASPPGSSSSPGGGGDDAKQPPAAAAAAAGAGADARRPPSKAAVLHRAATEITDLRAANARVERRLCAAQAERDRWRRRAEALWRADGREGSPGDYDDDDEEDEKDDDDAGDEDMDVK
jgi:hypothetical protein